MTTQLDELFSPERLRQHWQNSLLPVVKPPVNSPPVTIQAQYQHLERLIHQQFPDAWRLSTQLAELSEKITANFSVDASGCVTEAQKQFIVALLEELEELLWAMDLAKRET
jgi:hypothetical protein